jgi:hypothetical protein
VTRQRSVEWPRVCEFEGRIATLRPHSARSAAFSSSPRAHNLRDDVGAVAEARHGVEDVAPDGRGELGMLHRLIRYVAAQARERFKEVRLRHIRCSGKEG